MTLVVGAGRVANFAWNSFGDLGTQALGRALEQNNFLEVLDLSANHINGATVMVLAGMLAINDALTSLQLNRNTIGRSGARALLRAASTAGDENVTAIGLEDCNFQVCRRVLRLVVARRLTMYVNSDGSATRC